MNGKLVLISVLIIMLVTLGIAQAKPESEELDQQIQLEERKPDEGEYDAELYGRFFLTNDIIFIDDPPRELELQPEEEKIIDLQLKLDESRLERYFLEEMGIEEPVNDFKIRFLLVNEEKWKPSFESEKEHVSPSEIDDPEQLGKVHENFVKLHHEWYDSLEETTGNVYELEAETLRLDEENNSTETTVTLSIDQGGKWSLETFIKPTEGGYWFSHQSIPIDVERPEVALYNYTPIIGTGLIAIPVIYVTWKVKKRK